MKALYFDCNSGISGNMTLGALLELIDDKDYLLHELNKLNVEGYHMDISKKGKNGITGTYVDVILEHYEHRNGHHHEHRNLYDVNKIIDNSDIDDKAKDIAKRIFLRVAKAESKVHNESLENVHFHEVAAIDSIVDIIGTAILINHINPDIILSSVVNDGYGFIKCAHGTIPVPVPATSEIFASSDVISRQIDIDTELVTPTGAAIIAELASSYGFMPIMKVKNIGYGAGSKDLKIPNVLKVALGEMSEKFDDVIVMETTVLQRKKIIIDTSFGDINAKEVRHNNETYIYPEFESLKEIADKNNISIKELYKIIK
jgi:pyridinium-3,5-bisthiocarboxylic acid mononucleotide nickel chelatase